MLRLEITTRTQFFYQKWQQHLGTREIWGNVLVPGLSLPSCVTLSKSLPFSKPQFPHQYSVRDDRWVLPPLRWPLSILSSLLGWVGLPL